MKKTTLLLAVCLISGCAARSSMDRFIDDRMDRMTLEQKIGQLNLHSVSGSLTGMKLSDDDANLQAVREGKMGALYGSGNVHYLKLMQEEALKSGAGIPLMFGQDVIHGYQTIFPVPLARPRPGRKLCRLQGAYTGRRL